MKPEPVTTSPLALLSTQWSQVPTDPPPPPSAPGAGAKRACRETVGDPRPVSAARRRGRAALRGGRVAIAATTAGPRSARERRLE